MALMWRGILFSGLVVERWLRDKVSNACVFYWSLPCCFPPIARVQEKMAYERVAHEIMAVPMPLHPMWLFGYGFTQSVNVPIKPKITLSRLQTKPQTAQALKAVSQLCSKIALLHLLAVALAWRGFVGGLSWPVMHERHERLMRESKTGTTKP